MNKKCLVLALAALPASAVLADVAIYGEVRGGYEYNKSYNSTFDKTGNFNNKLSGGSEINDWSSRLGFKGNEDLGNGLKAIWQVESGVRIDNGAVSGTAGNLASRESFVGLAGDSWGKLRLGKIATYAYSDMRQIDPGYYSAQSVGGLAYFTRLDNYISNAVRYDSPDISGFSFAVTYGTDENRYYVYNTRTNQQVVNLGLSYVNKEYGFFGHYQYQYWGDADKFASFAITPFAINSLKDWHRVELGYDANHIYAVFGYQSVQGYNISNPLVSASAYYSDNVWNWISSGYTLNTSGDNKLKTREAALTLGYRFLDDKLTPYLSFGKGWDAKYSGQNLSDSGYQQYILGLSYDVSKRTSVYSSYGRVKWDASLLDKEQSYGLGLVHRF